MQSSNSMLKRGTTAHPNHPIATKHPARDRKAMAILGLRETQHRLDDPYVEGVNRMGGKINQQMSMRNVLDRAEGLKARATLGVREKDVDVVALVDQLEGVLRDRQPHRLPPTTTPFSIERPIREAQHYDPRRLEPLSSHVKYS